MKKLLFLITFLQIFLFGYEYDELTLKAQATVFPKLTLLDQDLSSKLVDNKIVFSIVYHEVDKQNARKIKELIEKQFGDNLGKYRLKVVIKSYEEIKNEKSTAYYILNSEDSQMQKVTQSGIDNNLIVYTYDKNYFQNNALISLSLKDSTIIYLNKEMLKNYKINFLDIFYQIVKFEN